MLTLYTRISKLKETLKKMGEEIRLVDDNRRQRLGLGEVGAKCSDDMVEDLSKDKDKDKIKIKIKIRIKIK